jgi:hypothetical protein
MKKSYDRISEAEFARIVDGIREDRDIIIKHNPLGTEDEILLWMLLSCLVSYLGLSDVETPCFPGKPTAASYREAIRYVLGERSDFDPLPYLDQLV